MAKFLLLSRRHCLISSIDTLLGSPLKTLSALASGFACDFEEGPIDVIFGYPCAVRSIDVVIVSCPLICVPLSASVKALLLA